MDDTGRCGVEEPGVIDVSEEDRAACCAEQRQAGCSERTSCIESDRGPGSCKDRFSDTSRESRGSVEVHASVPRTTRHSKIPVSQRLSQSDLCICDVHMQPELIGVDRRIGVESPVQPRNPTPELV
jgi:hypothetical protein